MDCPKRARSELLLQPAIHRHALPQLNELQVTAQAEGR